MQGNVISDLHRKKVVSGAGRVLLWLAGFPLFAFGAQSRGAETSPRPNIVFILSDDQAHNTLSLAGHPYIKTRISIVWLEREHGSGRRRLQLLSARPAAPHF